MSAFVFKAIGPTASRQNPTVRKSTVRKEKTALLFFLFPCPCPFLPSLTWKGKLTTEEGAETRQNPCHVCAGQNHCVRHPRKVQLRRQVTEEAGVREGESGRLVPLEGSSGGGRSSTAEGPVAEDALGKLFLSLLEAGSCSAVEGMNPLQEEE